PAERLGRWLSVPGRAERIVDEGARMTADLLDRIHEDDVRAVLTEMIVPRLVEEPLSPAAGQLLAEVVDSGAHAGVVDLMLDELAGWLRRHPHRITDLIKARAPRWAPDWANELVADKLLREALAWVEDIRGDAVHDVRRALDHWLAQLAEDLQHDAGTMARAERLKERLLGQPRAIDTSVLLWDGFRRTVVDALQD